MVLLIDNFDSFTYILKDYLEQIGLDVHVVRNDVSPEDIDWAVYAAVVISPGPHTPSTSNHLMEYFPKIHAHSVLGVCLGMQAMVEYDGGELHRMPQPQHGLLSEITYDTDPIFNGIPQFFKVVRYHSWVVKHLPPTLTSLAESQDQEKMVVKSLKRKWYGVQFHPESAQTQFGMQLLKNWADMSGLID